MIQERILSIFTWSEEDHETNEDRKQSIYNDIKIEKNQKYNIYTVHFKGVCKIKLNKYF